METSHYGEFNANFTVPVYNQITLDDVEKLQGFYFVLFFNFY